MIAELDMVIKLVLGVFLGGVLGFEREVHYKPAGLRTHMLVALGSTLFTILSISAFGPTADPSRVASYIVIGIGFIGAGTIMQIKERVIGITTAASLWVAAAIGMSTGLGLYLLASVTTLIAIITLRLGEIKEEVTKV